MAIQIAFVEATQGTQDQPTVTPNPRYPGTPLVAGKRTVLRVLYLLFGKVDPLPTVAAFALQQQSGPMGPQSQAIGSAAHRWQPAFPTMLNPSTTLQIVLPPFPPGRFALSLMVIQYTPAGAIVDIQQVPIVLDFNERRLIRVRVVRIRHVQSRFNDLPFDTAAPTIADFWRTAEYAQRMLPLPEPGFIVVGDSEVPYDGSFESIDERASDTTWSGFAQNRGTTSHIPGIVEGLVTAEALPPDVVYAGLFATRGAPTPRPTHSHGGRWLITELGSLRGAEDIRLHFAHEMAHLHGFPQHANCGDPGPLDPNFPDTDNPFRGFPSGSIGKSGFDTIEMKAFDPKITFDLMTECHPRWISPYTFQKVYESLSPLPPDQPGSSSFPFPGREQYVHLSFLELNGELVQVELPSVPRGLPRPPAPSDGEFQVLVLDKQGQLLRRFPATATPSEAGRGLERRVEAEVAYLDQATAIAVTANGRTVTERKLAGEPRLEARFPSPSELEEAMGVVHWSVEGSDECLKVFIRTSEDAGGTWRAVHVTGEAHGSFNLRGVFIGGTPACCVEVLATTGYHSRSHSRGPFRVRAHPRIIGAFVLSTAEGNTMRSPVELFAPANVGSGLQWTSNVDGPLGAGNRVRARLSEGPHIIEVRNTRPFDTPMYLNVDIASESSQDALSSDE